MRSRMIEKLLVIGALLIMGVNLCLEGLALAAQPIGKPTAGIPPGRPPAAPTEQPSDKLKRQSLESSNRATMQAMASSNSAQENGRSSVGEGHVAASIDGYTGTMTTAIPIVVPPGRHGMQPALQLLYRSGSPSGWLGIGWQLEMGMIERNTRFGVNYDNYGPGVFLFRMNGITSELVPDPSLGADYYRAKVEGAFFRFQLVSKGTPNAVWSVTDKAGTRYDFGLDSNGRMADPANNSRIFKWLLQHVQDPHGNSMKLSYTTDQGEAYLDEIKYAGYNSTDGLLSIKFYLEAPSDVLPPTSYVANYAMTTAKRLKAIAVRASGLLVRAYQLAYTRSSTTFVSRLSTVQQYGKDATVDANGEVIGGSTLPAITLAYQTDGAANSLTDGSVWGGGLCNGVADINGDGRQDLWCFNGSQYVALSNGAGSFSSGGSWLPYCAPMSPADFNGDGRLDLWCWTQSYDPELGVPYGPASYLVSLNDGAGGFASPAVWASSEVESFSLTGDVNGDGKQDVIGLTGASVIVRFSTGTSFGPTVSTGLNNWCGAGGPTGVGDFNGDGKTDVSCFGAGYSLKIALSTGNTLVESGTWMAAGWCPIGNVGMGDFNGDSKLDVWCMQGGYTVRVALSTGATFLPPAIWFTGWGENNFLGADLGVADFNGDGKSDLYSHTLVGSTLIALSTGASLVSSGAWRTNWCEDDPNYPNQYVLTSTGDFNGDGKSDLLCVQNPGVHGTVSVALSGSLVGRTGLLTRITNGIGGTTTIAYTPSTQFANTQLPYPMQVVNAITTNDGAGNAGTTTYSYTGGYHQSGERDFRGFKTATVTSPGASDADKTVTTTEFLQGRGVVVSGVTTVAADDPTVSGDASMKGLPFRVTVTKKTDPNFLYAKTETTYRDDLIGTNITAPYFTPQAVTTTSIYNAAGVLAKQTQTEAVSYDAYGNLTLSYNRGDFTGNNAITSDDTTTAITYAPANTTTWLIGFPTAQRTYAGLGTGGTKLSETLTYYDGTGSCTTPAGSATTLTKGRVTKVERWLNGGTNPISGMEYNAFGGVTCTRDPKGHITTMAYDPTNTFPLTSTNALGHLTTTVYYGVNGVASDTGLYGQAKSVTDPNNKTTTSTYDALGRPLTTTTPYGLVTTKVYNYGGTFVVGTQHVQSTISGGGLSVNLVSKTYFDGLGRTTKTERPGAADGGGALKVLVTETQYDVRGLTKQTSLPYFQGTESATGRWRTMTYDALGRLAKTTNPDTTSSQVCYSVWTTTSLDPKLHKKVETKDAFGRLVTVQEYTGTGSATDCSGGTLYAATTYSYDRLGNLLGVTDAKGNVSSMTYDTLGRKLTMHDPDMGNWSYTYDANGNLLTQVDAKNQKLCFSYDALNRRTQKNYGTTTVACGTNTVVYAYDDTVAANNGKGRLKQVTDPAQSVTFQYDSRGRIKQSAKTLDGTTYTITSAYDGLGRLTSVSYPTSPIQTVTYTYDGPQLKAVQEGAMTYVTYAGWNALGQPATSTFGNGVVTTNTYANTNNTTCTQQTFRLCTLKIQKGANPLYQDLRYDYEANGNVWNIYDQTVGANAGDQHFSYDDLDRLTLANGPYGASGINATLSYAYDEIGNLTLNSQLSASPYVYPASGASSIRPHAVTTAGLNSYTYDNNGNMTGGAGRTYTWNPENKPLTVVQGGTTTTFVYDGDGGRVKKIVGTTTTRYLSKLYECDNTNCSRFIWAGSTRIATIAMNTGAIQYWHGDHLGSSSVITDSTGAKVQSITYYPFGGTRTNQSPSTPAIDVPYKYTGKELDSTGLYYYEARYYDPQLARFISADTIVPNPRDPQDLNRYAYVRNNPLKYIDPSGHEGACAAGSSDPNCDLPIVTVPEITVTAPSLSSSFFMPGNATFSIDWLAHHTQVGLDLAGFVPALNTPAGLANAAISALRGQYGEAGLSALTAMPILGMIGKAGHGAEAVLKHLESILKPGGKLIGEAGSKGVQEITKAEMDALTTELSKLGEIIEKPAYKGTMYEIKEFGTFGFRDSKKHGPTIDLNLRGFESFKKFHLSE